MNFEIREKLPLTTDEKRDFDDIRWNYFSDSTKEQVELAARYAMYHQNRGFYNYFDNYEVDIVSNAPQRENALRFNGKTAIFKVSRYDNLSTLSTIVDYFTCEQKNKLKYGANVENVYPWALEMLFEGETPHSPLKIEDHFKDGNLAYVKTSIRKNLKKRNKLGQSYVMYDREMLIEKWGKNNENIKVKSKKALEEYLITLEQMRAPKASVINVAKRNTLRKFQNDYNFSDIAYKDGESYIDLKTVYYFRRKMFLFEVIHSWEVYNNGKTLWLKARLDSYGSDGNFDSTYLPDKFYKLNEFGGLVEANENPVIFTELVDQHKNEPEVIPYVHKKDFHLKLNEDRTEIVNPFENHPYLKAKITKETPYAREYTTTNLVDGETTAITYFTKYNDIWIHSNLGDDQINQMIEVYELAEKLVDEEDEAV